MGEIPPPPMRKRTIHSREYKVLLAMLREARAEAGLTQIDMAKRLGITQSAVSKSELGELRLDVVQLRDWCRALGISFPEFAADFHKQAG